MHVQLNGKTVLITGAAKGIGKAIALEVAGAGANIALHYHQSKEEAKRTAEEIRELGVDVQLVSGDLGDYANVDALYETTGPVDAIVNNAGWTQLKPFFSYERGEWQKEIDICLQAVMNLAHRFVPDMMERGSGKFINLIGDSARTGDRYLSVSGAARSGAASFVKSLAQEAGRSGVQCNTVSLGMIDQGELDESLKTKLVKQYPLGTLGDRTDVANMTTFLLSEQTNWVTGQVIAVNGGYTMIG
ncbi:SDR family NAD(P)-dependent oxidoreductase [Geomicrobium sp. JSM 1781026]|uniref:SDR family NAD(P)-dependent oxidoreductase n=1 Tax=Geomicrobium sp. JSM 1781026 TaxID=3344580 RepID=UPI0035C16B8C